MRAPAADMSEETALLNRRTAPLESTVVNIYFVFWPTYLLKSVTINSLNSLNILFCFCVASEFDTFYYVTRKVRIVKGYLGVIHLQSASPFCSILTIEAH